MKSNLSSILFFFLALIIGAVVTYVVLITQTKKHLPSESVPTQKTLPKFTVENPPSDSLSGTIHSFSGEVKWQSRTATEAAKITHTITLSQGENLETMKDGDLIFRIASCEIHLTPKSNLAIIQTLPSNLVFEQTKGDVSYSDSCSIPLAVRSGGLLIQKNTGEMKITVDQDEQTIQIENTEGEATAGFNSLDSKTTLVSVPEQTRYSFDTETKEGSLKKLPRKLTE